MKSTSFSPGRTVKGSGERAFFISANGYGGFRTMQPTFYKSQDFERVFLIFGGPGTGKSSLMRKVASAAEGGDAVCEYIYCSSDIRSLDGVIITKEGHRIAILDATAPHERGADVPGAIDEVIQLGECWNADMLTKKRPQILREREDGARATARARRYLALAGEAQQALEGELDGILEKEKMRAAIRREIRSVRVSNRPCEQIRYLSACGAEGVVRLDTFAKDSEVIFITNDYGAGHRYLNEMRAILQAEGVYAYWCFPSCFDDKITDGIYLPQNKSIYLVDNGDECARKINIKRFVNKESAAIARADIRRLLRIREESIGAATHALAVASSHHFALEAIYGQAMDFRKKEVMTNTLVKRVCDILDT